jgi:hypothetical protein
LILKIIQETPEMHMQKIQLNNKFFGIGKQKPEKPANLWVFKTPTSKDRNLITITGGLSALCKRSHCPESHTVYPVNTNGALDNVLWQWVPEGPMSLRPS